MNPFQNKKLLVGVGVVGLLVVISIVLVASGALKLSFTVKQNPSSTAENIGTSSETKDIPFKKVSNSELASRPVTFKDKRGNLEFSIRLPVGWAVANNSNVDFIAGSLIPEKLENGQTFTANLNAIVDKHPTSMKSFSDYQKNWKTETLAQYPSMEFLVDFSTKINDMDVYVLEVSNARPDGLLLRQIQYVFYINDKYVMIATGTAPLNSWITYEGGIKASIESLEVISQK